MKTLTKIIRGVMFYWVIFVTVSWIAFFVKGQIPDTLVQYGLGGGAVELIVGGFIEIAKHVAERKYGGENDGSNVPGPADNHDSDQCAADAGCEKNAG